jgi:hypothetical protein
MIVQLHPHIFWSGSLVHTLNILMHDIVKHRECRWINDLYKRGKQLIKFELRIQGSIISITCKNSQTQLGFSFNKFLSLFNAQPTFYLLPKCKCFKQKFITETQ